MEESVRFYFSFRSPYAWLAAERLDETLGDLGVTVERIPIFPTPELFPNDPSAHREKIAYLVQDVRRLTRERGLTLRFPSVADTDWAAPHAAYLGARELGDGDAFMRAVFRKRFSEGKDVGEDAVLAEAAEDTGLPAAAVVEAAQSGSLRAETSAGWQRGVERDGIFGVPSFLYAGKLYWGQDRMHFLRNAIERKRGATA